MPVGIGRIASAMLIGLELIESSKEGQLLANCKAINPTCRIVVMIMDGYGQDDKNEVITPREELDILSIDRFPARQLLVYGQLLHLQSTQFYIN